MGQRCRRWNLVHKRAARDNSRRRQPRSERAQRWKRLGSTSTSSGAPTQGRAPDAGAEGQQALTHNETLQ
jgi:hypothetical protein